MSVVNSRPLYACPTWAERACKYAICRNLMIWAQRIAALRVTRAYRTVSTEAALFLAGIPPGDLLALERKRVRSKLDDLDRADSKDEIRRAERDILLAAWSNRWSRGIRGAWTRTILPDLIRWTKRCPKNLSFHATQALTGHGCFRYYLHRMKRAPVAACLYCQYPEDTAEHTIFDCAFWDPLRLPVKIFVGNRNITLGDVQDLLCGPSDVPSSENDRLQVASQRATQAFYDMAMKIYPEMSELTSIIMISSFELSLIGKFVSHSWRIFFDDQLSIVLTKLETTHEKMIGLNVVGPIKIKMNWIPIIGVFLNVIGIIVHTIWITNHIQSYNTFDVIRITVSNTCQFVIFYEYILLILYTQWIVYKINDQIPERTSSLSTFRDMYLEVVECLNDINKSIYGWLAIIVFIASNVADIIFIIYNYILFPRHQLSISPFIILLVRKVNVLTLYKIGHATEKEINRMNLVLHQRSVVEKNPRIKRQSARTFLFSVVWNVSYQPKTTTYPIKQCNRLFNNSNSVQIE
ncbi:hypothetical protein QTP88_015796 [Uroleucon formosanum]